ncbi:MAG: thermonuclease family protein [Mycobacteriales bacterium]
MRTPRGLTSSAAVVASALVLAGASVGAVVGVQTRGRSTLAPAAADRSPPRPVAATRARVESVVDGDTVKLRHGGGIVTVRLLGLDTPETHDPRKPVQCFGPQAAARAVQLLSGASVWIAADPGQSRHDRYGRELDYLWLADGVLYDWLMIRDGFAHEYVYGTTPYVYHAAFHAAEADAHRGRLGLWSPATCRGDTTRPATGYGATPSAARSPP